MPVHYTDSPSSELPGSFIGAPVHLPAVLLCQAAGPGRRWCGAKWTANTERQFAEKSAERRTHEQACEGGLIVAQAGEHG
jgi:hypothetical protein